MNLRRLLLLVTIGFIAGLFAIAPARLVSVFLPGNISLDGLSGTLWNGAARQLVVDNTATGELEWEVKPSQLFTGRLGLSFISTLPDGSILKSWPYLPSGNNATFQNLLAACTTNATNVVDEDLWLGTDPLLEDSDRYHWDGFSVRRLFPSYGDGMTDGWEAHFGLDPLNRTDALLDPDGDGWDFNRDGVVSPDVSRTRTALKIGEELSNFEEYLIHFDDGNSIIPGLKTA